jgi:hypothetical protein
MKLQALFLASAALALALPGSASAAAPWTDPVNVGTGGPPAVVADTVAFNAPGSFPGVALMRSVNGAPATEWNTGGADFDAQFGAFAGDSYIGSNGAGRVIIGHQSGDRWTVKKYGPKTGGARVAAALGASVFATFERGGGHVYLVREGHKTQRLSARGSIRSVAVATNQRGDVLAAWDRHGTVEYRMWRHRHLTPVAKLGSVTAAMHLSASLFNDRRAVVAWVDQPVNEGGTNTRARIVATVRTASRSFGKPQVLDTYPDLNVVSGVGVKTAYTAGGRGVIAWSGRTAVRAALINGRLVGTPVDLATVPGADGDTTQGLTDLAVSGEHGVATIGTGTQVLAAPLVDGTFGPADAVSAPTQYVGRASAGFIDNRAVVAWTQPGGAVEVAQRPF